METVQFIYNDQPVDFQPTGKENVMVNATQMAKIFGKRVDHFLKSDHAKAFIKVLELTPFGVNSEPLKEEEILQTNQRTGTWMHRILALKFAAWLDPTFEVWVFTTMDRIINHYFREQRDVMIEKLSIKAKKEALRNDLIAKHPEFMEYFELEEQEKSANARRAAIIREQMKQLQIDFSSPTDKEA